jgi:hypothetical protein
MKQLGEDETGLLRPNYWLMVVVVMVVMMVLVILSRSSLFKLTY